MDAPTASLQPIVLAHESPFAIGSLQVRPETCEIDTGERILILEPRVMQVLVALHQAAGHVVSRDDLLARCWSGRIVGEDAIHRVISRLRHEAQEAGGQFRIETITRVGYRLIPIEVRAAGDTDSPVAPSATTLNRRALLGGVGGLAALAGLGLAWDRWRSPPLPENARSRIEEGKDLWDLGTMEGYAAAQAAFKSAAALAPEHPLPWGLLAISYAFQSVGGHPAMAAEAERGCRASMARAFELERREPHAMVAGMILDFNRKASPLAPIDRRFRQLDRSHPDNPYVLDFASYFLAQVGRPSEALGYMDRWTAIAGELPPRVEAAQAYLLFNVGRVDEADQVTARTLERWPRHTSVWFSALKRLMYSQRYDRALAMLDDMGRRPLGIPEWNFELSRLQILALAEPIRHSAKAVEKSLESARQGTGFAENALLFLAALGRTDDAFRVADALYFDRGWSIGPQRFTREQGHHVNRRRGTSVLFEQGTKALRQDRRFARLTQGLGLESYWRETGSKPDYRA